MNEPDPTMDALVELTDALNELLGMVCGEECAHRGACTREPKHDGDHQAILFTTGEVVCTWPQLLA